MAVTLPLEMFEVLEKEFGKDNAKVVVKSLEMTISETTEYKWRTSKEELLDAIRKDFATKHDLKFVAEHLERRLVEEIGKVREEIGKVNERITEETGKLREEIGKVNERITEETGKLREEIGKVNERITEETGKLREEIGKVNERITEESGKLRLEIEKSSKETIKWMFLFWIGQIAAMAAVIKLLLH